ncbi:MAG: hypothetical protein ACLFVE_00510 [Chitinispirillaceae bacterium]
MTNLFENTVNAQFFNSIWFILLSGILLIVLSSAVSFRLSKTLQNRKLRKRFSHGKASEEKAVRYFKKHGYRILDTQVKAESWFYANERKQSFEVKADLLVQKGGTQFLVEVKTGEDAKPSHASTRRQIFEYNHIYKPDKLVLFDADREQHYLISFETVSANTVSRSNIKKLIAAVISGLAAGLLLGGFLW